ncbi:hypothetical protein BDQ17DRAFT_1329662 [Cyathus striatus]|nr:hypothetical protein BDQ17DRAFT_1329662 [Cyathus striatus]
MILGLSPIRLLESQLKDPATAEIYHVSASQSFQRTKNQLATWNPLVLFHHLCKLYYRSLDQSLSIATLGFENGRVPPERRGQLVTVVNHLNHQIYRGEYQVVDLKGEAVFAYPHKGKKRLDRGINIPMGDLAVIAKRR